MKRVAIILSFVFSVLVGKAQLADTTTLIIGGISSTGWIKTTAFLPWQTNDSLTGVMFNGSPYVRVFSSSRLFTTQELLIVADGTDQSARLNYVLSKTFVKGVMVDANNGDDYTISSSVNWKNKLLIMSGTMKIKGSGIIDSAVIQAPANVHVFDTTLVFTNSRSNSNYLTLDNFGGKGDSIVNNYRYLQKMIDLRASNFFDIVMPFGNYYYNGTNILKSNVSITGWAGVKVSPAAGSQWSFNDATLRNVFIGNFDFELSNSGTNADFFNFNTMRGQTPSENINVFNITMQMHREGGIPVMFQNIVNSYITNVEVDSSASVSIQLNKCVNVKVNNCRVLNSGRSGIAVSDSCTNNYIQGNYVDGFMQFIELTDGGIDSYGPANIGNYFIGNIVHTGTLSFNNAIGHTLFRNQGGTSNTWVGNKGYSNSQYLLYGARDANRNEYIGYGNMWIDNEITIYGNVSRAVSVQGVIDFKWIGGKIEIDSSATTTGTPTFFRFSSGVQDTLKNVTITGVKLIANGKEMYTLDWDLPVNGIHMNQVECIRHNNSFFVTSRTSVVAGLHIDGLVYNTTATTNPFPLNDIITSFSLTNSDFDKNGSTFYTTSGFSGQAAIRSNFINNVLADDYPPPGNDTLTASFGKNATRDSFVLILGGVRMAAKDSI